MTFSADPPQLDLVATLVGAARVVSLVGAGPGDPELLTIKAVKAIAAATVLLVDDVLYTGRTTRAAINELFDYGRPARIMLAALVHRGERQLPVAADFVAGHVAVPKGQALVLQKRADDGKFTLTIE